jgi:polysaccharide biosynthesis/export protein
LGVLKSILILLFLASFCFSCSSYKQNIMFRVPDGHELQEEISKAQSNYVIQKNDLLELQVYTNKGERILDQNLTTLQPSSSTGAANLSQETYLVKEDGTVRFPLIDNVKIEGLKLSQAQEIIQNEFKKYYQEPFVILNYSNKRVTVLGAAGGKVIPLVNENVRLTEIIALSNGTAADFKAHNIRIMRGDKVLLADLSTIDGYLKYNFLIQPDDVIYIEPVRRPALEAIRDYSSVLGVFTSITTLVVLIISVNQ